MAFFNLSGKVFQIFEELGMRYFEIHGKLLLLQVWCIQHYFLVLVLTVSVHTSVNVHNNDVSYNKPTLLFLIKQKVGMIYYLKKNY